MLGESVHEGGGGIDRGRDDPSRRGVDNIPAPSVEQQLRILMEMMQGLMAMLEPLEHWYMMQEEKLELDLGEKIKELVKDEDDKFSVVIKGEL